LEIGDWKLEIGDWRLEIGEFRFKMVLVDRERLNRQGAQIPVTTLRGALHQTTLE
jgi:hypothetical protein